MAWFITNYRERHLKRNGKIIGKIQKGPGECLWAAILAGRPRRLLGFRFREEDARLLVESEIS